MTTKLDKLKKTLQEQDSDTRSQDGKAELAQEMEDALLKVLAGTSGSPFQNFIARGDRITDTAPIDVGVLQGLMETSYLAGQESTATPSNS